jgi:hypothetical protein
LAQAYPFEPLFVLGWPAWHGKKTGCASTKPDTLKNSKKQQKNIENVINELFCAMPPH